MRGRTRRWGSLALLVAALAATSCVRVRAWERGTLAKACMQFDADPEETALEQHTFAYREGAAGGYGGGGGGCGCN